MRPWMTPYLLLAVSAWASACACQDPPLPDDNDDDTDQETTGDTSTTPTADTGPELPCDVPEVEPNDTLNEPTELPMDRVGCGGFDAEGDFVYDAEHDEYRCPAGERAIWRFSSVEKGLTIHKYWPSACPRCALRSKCTTGDYRRIARWEHEQVLDALQRRLDAQPLAMQRRRSTVEHPFGTIKAWMGATHFLCRRLPRVSAEMSLHVLAYNLKRVMKIMGTGPLLEALRA